MRYIVLFFLLFGLVTYAGEIKYGCDITEYQVRSSDDLWWHVVVWVKNEQGKFTEHKILSIWEKEEYNKAFKDCAKWLSNKRKTRVREQKEINKGKRKES